MNRRDFLKSIGVIASALALSPTQALSNLVVPIKEEQVKIICAETFISDFNFKKFYSTGTNRLIPIIFAGETLKKFYDATLYDVAPKGGYRVAGRFSEKQLKKVKSL